MRDFMVFCLEVLKQLVSLYFNFDLGGYSYGNFLVACMLVSLLLGALVIKFSPSKDDYIGGSSSGSSGGSGAYRGD